MLEAIRHLRGITVGLEAYEPGDAFVLAELGLPPDLVTLLVVAVDERVCERARELEVDLHRHAALLHQDLGARQTGDPRGQLRDVCEHPPARIRVTLYRYRDG